MSLTCIGVAGEITLTTEFSDGATEFLEVLFRLGGRNGDSSTGAVTVTGYSSRFHPRNALILPIVVLLLIERVNYDL